MKNQYAKTWLGSLSLKLLRSSIILELSEKARSTEGLYAGRGQFLPQKALATSCCQYVSWEGSYGIMLTISVEPYELII